MEENYIENMQQALIELKFVQDVKYPDTWEYKLNKHDLLTIDLSRNEFETPFNE